MSNIILLVSSMRTELLNQRLSCVAPKLLPKNFVPARYDPADTPFFDTDLERAAPESVLGYREAIDATDGVLWTVPEYHHGLLGFLENATDLASRPMLARSSLVSKRMNGVVASGSVATATRDTYIRKVT
jgi:chromate reductase